MDSLTEKEKQILKDRVKLKLIEFKKKSEEIYPGYGGMGKLSREDKEKYEK